MHVVETVHRTGLHPGVVLFDAILLLSLAFLTGFGLAQSVIVTVSFVATAYVAGVYADRDLLQSRGVLWFTGIIFIPFSLVGFASTVFQPSVRQLLLVYTPLAIVLLTGVRAVTWCTLVVQRRRGRGLRRTMVLGESPSVELLVRRLQQFPDAGLDPVATGSPSLLQPSDQMVADLTRHQIQHVVFALNTVDAAVIDRLRQYHNADVTFSLVPLLGALALRPGQVAEVAGIPFLPLGRVPRGFPGKRAFDLLVGSLLTLCALPVLALTALLVKLNDGGPVLYRQQRVGRNGRMFSLLKFRSMVVGADKRRDGLTASNVADGLLFKLDMDPRLTRIGEFLRRTSLDELPQLWNVLRGEMSLVGPRPLPVDPSSFGPIANQRHVLRPGITGYWQVSGGNGLTYREMVKLDLAYLHNWSLWLDVRLLLRTLPAIIHRTGPV